jgi:hypothetical protein
MEHTGFFSLNMFYACLLFVFGNVFGWYASNLQFVNDYWQDKPALAVFAFGLPSMFSFWFGTKFAMMAVPELWTVRFVGAALSYLAFPMMTWYYLGESMFTIKTMICVALAFSIMMVQIYFS